jgi:hemin uptake protein HemP
MPRTNDLRRQDPPSHQADLPRICSSDLLRGGNLLLIEHAGERYYLRMTRHNKLILTK